MAKIVAHISTIAGTSETTGYLNHLDAVAIRETLEIPATSGGDTTYAKHSDIMLIRQRDKASPKLADACASRDRSRQGHHQALQHPPPAP